MSETFNINLLDSLPTVILLEIFTRLPLHDVARCKIVCKSWLNLISQPNFLNNYTRYSPYTSLLLVEACWRTKVNFNSSLLQFSDNGLDRRTPLESSPKHDNKHSRDFISDIYISVSNGLICLFQINLNKVERVFISNPMTRESVALPPPPLVPNRYYKDREFAFCPSKNQFKVLRIALQVQTKRTEVGPRICKSKLEIDILTVGVDDKWRRIITDPVSVRLPRYGWHLKGITYNGAYNWIVANKIHTLDLSREKEGPIIHLPRGAGDIRSMMRLHVLSDNLCLVGISFSSQLTIWMMREYGEGESWTKRVISQCWFPAHTWPDHTFSPAELMRNERVLIFSEVYGDNCALFYGEMKGNECRQFRVSDAKEGSLSCQIFAYVPSFRTLEEITTLKGERKLLCDALRN